MFGIFCFIRSHDSAALEDELQRQCVLLEVTHPQRRRDRTQLPRDRSHHLAEKRIEFRDRRKRVEAPAKCFVRSPQLGRTLQRERLSLACEGSLHFVHALRLRDVCCDATNRARFLRVVVE